MQLGFVSALFHDLGLHEVLDFAATENFDCVELVCWPQHQDDPRLQGVCHVDVANLSDDDAEQIRKAAAERGLQISGLGYYPNPLHPDEHVAGFVVDHLKKVISAAPRLGIDRVNTFIGRDWWKSVDDNWPRMQQTWGPILEHAERENVRVGIENCPMLFRQDQWPGGENLATCPAVWRRLFAEFPSPNLGLNFDPSHLIWQHIDYLEPIAEFADRIFHTHAKDARLDRRALSQLGLQAFPTEYHTAKLPGLGEVDWSAFISKLRDIRYDGPVCVEVEDHSFDGSLESRKDALRLSARYLRQFII
tara:strand:- start:827 stop:1741 length:915 start_codon:yes stop_codon:yes gene_type:complete